MAARIRTYSTNTECTRPRTSPSLETANLIAASCEKAKTRPNAAIATDGLISAIYSDMIQQVDHYIDSNPDAVKEFTRLGPVLQELKGALQAVRDDHSGPEGKETEKAVSKKIGDLLSYGDWTLPEHLKPLEEMGNSLWAARLEISRIERQKFEWCGRWCEDKECPKPEKDGKVGRLGARQAEEEEREEEMEYVKVRALSLLSEQMKANELLVQQVKDQKLEMDGYMQRLRTLELKVEGLDEEDDDDGDDDEEDGSKGLPRHQGLLSDRDSQEDNHNHTTPAAKDATFNKRQWLH